MDLKELMSGIAVVIDDAFDTGNSAGESDPIFQLVKEIEEKWNTPFYTNHQIPSEDTCRNLLQSASFVLLDWRLWKGSGGELEKTGIENNLKFLELAEEYFVPVFIFTNDSPDDVEKSLNAKKENDYILIEQKSKLTGEKVFNAVKRFIESSSSVYTLKAWEQSLYQAKRDLFNSFYTKTPDWPKIFWSTYKEDGVDPNFSLVSLINDNLVSRMQISVFESAILQKGRSEKAEDGVKLVIEEAMFISKDRLPDDIRAGDLFKCSGGKYYLNIRPDCDCVPRARESKDDVELYCLKGKRLTNNQLKSDKVYSEKNGNFNETVAEAILFPIDGGRAIRFDFKLLEKSMFKTMKKCRIGRLTHPYITRIQQRYALYLQRQGLPRIPKGVIR